jgi:LDH2 family malate/lactate/ureidoglycolate dehydrogenase
LNEVGKAIPHQLGHFFIAIDIPILSPLKSSKNWRRSRAIHAHRAKAARRKRIYTAGEKEFENEKRIPIDGVPLNTVMQKTLHKMADELRLDVQFPFS